MIVLAIPPILVNTYAGRREVDRDLIEAATGMGMTGAPGPRRRRAAAGGRRRSSPGWARPPSRSSRRPRSARSSASAASGRYLVEGISQNDDAMMFSGVVLVALLALSRRGRLHAARARPDARGVCATGAPEREARPGPPDPRAAPATVSHVARRLRHRTGFQTGFGSRPCYGRVRGRRSPAETREETHAVIPHARPRGVGARAGRRGARARRVGAASQRSRSAPSGSTKRGSWPRSTPRSSRRTATRSTATASASAAAR